MRTYEKCKHCKEFAYLDTHRCPPKWWVVDLINGDFEDPYPAYSYDAEGAAEKTAEELDTEDYSIAQGQERGIYAVYPDGTLASEINQSCTYHQVHGEFTPDYSVSDLELSDIKDVEMRMIPSTVAYRLLTYMGRHDEAQEIKKKHPEWFDDG